MPSQSKHNLRSVVRKVLAAFLLVSVAITLAMAIARFSFRELMGTVQELSRPNEKLIILNRLFEEITTLDQLQRAEAIKNPNKPYSTFLNQSVAINAMIDSLKTLPWDTAQLFRLEEMKGVLSERNKLFFSYLKVKAELLDNREFSVQLDTLEAILENDALAIDSSIITTHKKTTTTYLRDTTPLPKSEQRSLLKKLFSKKRKTPVDTPRISVKEELSVVVDTLAYARQNHAIREIEKIMREMEIEQHNQRRKLQRQELELIHANSLFINQLLNILHDVENEELQDMRNTNGHAVTVMNQSISRINILMLTFFLAAALLVYLIWIDISRSNYYKEQLEQARDHAEELSKIKQRFLANMSHEIRTPLQSIIGFAEQLKRKNGGRQEEVDAIYSSSEHLLQIVNEVLDYSRISSGNFVLARERFRLLNLIKEVESAMRVQAESKNLTFVLDTEKSSEYLLTGDPFRLRQILYNVIGNAIKFTHRGFIRLSLRTIEEGLHVVCFFEVADTGIGIEKPEIDRIFNQFEQANTSIAKHYGGTGLGLTIVKSLVDAMEGKLELSSQPGIGSSFRMELRFEKAAALGTHKTLYSEPVTTSRFDGKAMVIDDDTLILRLCSLILKKNGVDYITFNHAQTLLTESADPDITHIFMDIRMPDINGVDLCLALRKKYPPSTRFIALTAHVLPDEKETLLKEGLFDAVLAKPFHENELLGVLGIPAHLETDEPEESPNVSVLKQMTMGDEALFQSIVAQFVEESLEDIVRIKAHIGEDNGQAVREVVHKMAGRFAQVGMRSLASRLHTIEKELVAEVPLELLQPVIAKTLQKVSEAIIQIRLTTVQQLN